MLRLLDFSAFILNTFFSKSRLKSAGHGCGNQLEIILAKPKIIPDKTFHS